MEYKNALRTKNWKLTDRYLNELCQSDMDENYRWQLRSLLGKVVRIESLNYEIETKTLESETGEYNVKMIILKNAQITRVKPYNNENLPILIDHIWIMVGDDFNIDKKYNKIRVDGMVNEYIKSSGVKDIGIDAENITLNDGKQIVVPKNYKNKEADKTNKVDDVDNVVDETPVLCPDEFKDMVLNAKECELLGYRKLYDLTKNPNIQIVRMFGGPFKFQNMMEKLDKIPHLDIVYNYLKEHEGVVFDVNDLTTEEKLRYLGNIITQVTIGWARYRSDYGYYNKRTKDWTAEYLPNTDYVYETESAALDHSYYYQFHKVCASCEFIMNQICACVNWNKKSSNNFIMKALEQTGYITIESGYIGTYEQEMAEYNKLMAEREVQIKALREQFGSLDIVVKEPVKPVNKDFTYYYGVPTEKAINLCKWFGVEIPKHVPLTAIPEKE